MWLQDLKKAVDLLHANPKYKEYLFQKIIPSEKCIVFFTTHYTLLRVYRDGKIEEVQP